MMESLLAAARAVQPNAHAPYSRFKVGAALLDEQGRIHVGVNVENAAHPAGQCAEASAIGALVTAGGKRILACAVVGSAAEPCAPCGACRQKLAEFAHPDTSILMAGTGEDRLTLSLADLLPHAFGAAQLPEPRNGG